MVRTFSLCSDVLTSLLLRVLMGEGKVDFSSSNANELVNPNGKYWQWRTAADIVREYKI